MRVSPKAYLDTNVFIAAYEHATARADHARWLLDAVEDGRIVAVTSELTLAELLVKPIQENATEIVAAYQAIVRPAPGFEVGAITREVLLEAAVIRADRLSIRLPDAIHVATARHFQCDAVITDNGRLSTRNGPPSLSFGPDTLDHVVAAARR